MVKLTHSAATAAVNFTVPKKTVAGGVGDRTGQRDACTLYVGRGRTGVFTSRVLVRRAKKPKVLWQRHGGHFETVDSNQAIPNYENDSHFSRTAE